LGLVVALASAWLVPSHGQEASKTAKASETSLARYVPRRDLIFYLEFDGLDAHADAWKNSAASKVLNDTKLGALLEDLSRQGIEFSRQSVPPDRQVKPATVIDLFKHVAKHGGAMAVWGKPDELEHGKVGMLFVARRADRPDVRSLLEAASKRNFARAGQEQGDRKSVPKASRTYHPLDKEGGWWFEKGDLSSRTSRTSCCPSSTASSPMPWTIRSAPR
jgi:hypothetical protein